jgi:hypothetical protein
MEDTTTVSNRPPVALIQQGTFVICAAELNGWLIHFTQSLVHDAAVGRILKREVFWSF